MNKFNTVSELIYFIENQRRIDPKINLDKMKGFCKVLGNPEKTFKSIHVTGTNGKGSVVSYLKSIFMEHGLNVATFTSPYITKFNERIAYNNQPISDNDLLEIGNLILSKYNTFNSLNLGTPSFFEFVTLIGFIYFNKLKIDIAIIEVGIGGLLDSTNVIDSICSVITNVNYDHMNILGNTLEEILDNKLGILKPNTSLIVGLKDQHLNEIAENKAKELHSKFYSPLLKAFEIKKCDILSSRFVLEGLGELEISLPGIHQIENAIVSIETFLRTKDLLGIDYLDIDKIRNGLQKTKWPGRLEVVSNEPLIVLDGGHNIDGVTRVCEFVKTLKYDKKRCVFACSDNKEKEKMIKQIAPVFDEIIITSFTYKRHSSAQELFDYLEHPNKILIENIDEIIKYVYADPYDFNLFLGSLYFVSETRPKLKA